MLVEACFEIGYTRLELGQLLLLLAHDHEQCAHEVSHGERGQTPFVTGNPSWWRRVVHTESMPGVGAVVKLVRFTWSGSDPVNDYLQRFVAVILGQRLYCKIEATIAQL